MAKIISKKRPPKLPDEKSAYIIQQIYDHINEIINAVNQYIGAGSSSDGKPGNIRITEDGLEYRDKTGWHLVSDA